MAIDKFIYILFVFVLGIQFINIDTKKKDTKIAEQPLLILKDSIIYSLNSENMDKIIESRVFTKYKATEVLETATIVTRTNKENVNNVLSADFMIKKQDKIELIDNIKYTQGNNISLETNKLNYNLTTKIATNDVKFNGIYNNNIIKGTHLYLDTQKNIIKSKNTHFDIKTKENNEMD
jgi:hypothetical protein